MTGTTLAQPVEPVSAALSPRWARPTGSDRIRSLDIIRGMVMVLMAIDHVRVYSGVPAGGPAPAVFFTRWVTHFCAPAFVFLAGTGAYLYSRRPVRGDSLSRFLLTRGIWLVLLELTVIRLAWTFNFDDAHYLLAGVIWMLGWCMILLAVLVRLPVGAVGGLGLAIVLLHNLLDPWVPALRQAVPGTALGWLAQIAYLGGAIPVGGETGTRLVVLYTVIPWIGVMAAGYGFGPIMMLDRDRRQRWCLAIGLGAVTLFVILRVLEGYGEPAPWRESRLPGMLAFLNATKYPASLVFLLMTLGPVIAGVPFLERPTGRLAGALAVFGRVPFFFYVLHIPVIHLLAVLVAVLRQGNGLAWLVGNHPMMIPPAPPGYRWPFWLLYLVFGAAVGLLYLPCRYFARIKASHGGGWLKYF